MITASTAAAEADGGPRFDLDGKKVLIVRMSALGDVIRTIPAVTGLIKRFPRSDFHWLVENTSGGLLRTIPGLKPIEVDRQAMRGSSPRLRLRALSRTLATLREGKFDVSIDFHGVLKSAMFPLFAGIPLRIGYEKGGSKEGHRWLINERYRMPRTDVSRYERNLMLARYVHAGVEPEVPQLVLPRESEEKVAAAMADRPVLLFPGTSAHGRNKRWPAENWAWLFRHLAPDRKILFSFGPEDGHYREALEDILGDPVPALPPLSLVELGRALSHARLLISCDTGPMHLASVLQVPLVAMLGPSDPALNMPLPGKTRVLLPGVPCAPCRHRGCKVLICQDATTPKRVYEAALDLLAELEAS